MSTQVVAEYVEEGFVILQDSQGTFIFNQEDSILPVDDDHPLSLRMHRPFWRHENESINKLPKLLDPGFKNLGSLA